MLTPRAFAVCITSDPSEEFRTSLQQAFGFELPTDTGVDAVESVKMMNDGKLWVFVSLGGNFTRSVPDTPDRRGHLQMSPYGKHRNQAEPQSSDDGRPLLYSACSGTH